MSHEIDKYCLSIFLARKFDFWSQWIQWIYIELYIYPQAIAWTYMNFNRYPHIGRGPTCRLQSSSIKPLRLHSMHFTRAFPFIHWCRCKLLASMWVSLASFILKLSMSFPWSSEFLFAWENAHWTLPGIHQRMLDGRQWPHSLVLCSRYTLLELRFVEADIGFLASTPSIIRLAIAKQACKFPAAHTEVEVTELQTFL